MTSNHIPLPAAGPIEAVAETSDTIFNWDYALDRDALVFSKIVPNVRRLGLLTPRVREAFARIGVLQCESLPDSTQDETVTMPADLAAFLAGMGQTSGAATAS